MNQLQKKELRIAQILSSRLFSATQVLEIREILGGSLNILQNFKNTREIFYGEAHLPEWMKRLPTGETLERNMEQMELCLKRFEKEKGYPLKYISAFDENFPSGLRALSHMPSGVFYSGTLDAKMIGMGMIGTRKPSLEGQSLVAPTVHECVSRDLCTVSGLAPGIDSVVHKETLQQDGKTLAILGSGHGYPLSIQRDRMIEEILKKGGAVLSEYEPFSFPQKKNFILRNRLIAALSKKLIVFEAALKSGTFITADKAAELEKEIWIPWMSYRSRTTEGLHELYLRFPSVQLFLKPKEIFTRYGEFAGLEKSQRLNQSESQQEVLFEDLPFEIHRFLKRKQIASIEEIKEAFNESHTNIQRALFRLRLFGHIEEKEGGHYVPVYS